MKTTILKKILTIFLLLVFPGEAALGVEISIKSIDLGDIHKNSVVTREIKIKNNESRIIILEKARASCECLTLKYEKNKSLKKNETCSITLDLNPGELSEGKLKKFIFLYFKNSEQPISSIEIRGNILNP